MAIYFISDLHLDEQRPDLTQALQLFLLEKTNDAEALYILGDLFEVWIGDDYHNEFNQYIIQLLKTKSKQCPIYICHGNRDFLLAENFAQQANIHLIEDRVVINLYGVPTAIEHGDALCTDDVDYIAFRNISRTDQWQQQILSQPIEARLKIAQQSREQSIMSKANKASNIMDANQEEIEKVLNNSACTQMIHGHTHRPATHHFKANNQTYTRYVLGDWGNQFDGWYIRADQNSIKLSGFSLDTKAT